MEGATIERFYPRDDGRYGAARELTHTLMKVETHNHPTAIAPFPGAATGSGGEIRDEGATGIGAKPKAGLVPGLHPVSQPASIPGSRPQPWEARRPTASPAASPPRSRSCSTARSAARRSTTNSAAPTSPAISAPSSRTVAGEVRGYHKPIMLAGGVGNIRAEHTHKQPLPAGTLLIQLGGPGMLIGLGGGAASSMATGANAEDLDFDSVQRGNAEIERRAQEVIDRCWQLGAAIRSSRSTTSARAGSPTRCPSSCTAAASAARSTCARCRRRSPACRRARSGATRRRSATCWRSRRRRCRRSRAICERERCPFAVVGTANARGRLVVDDPHFGNTPVDMPLDVLLGKPPRMTRDVAARRARAAAARPVAASICATPPTACCSCRRSPTRPSSSPSATAPSAACARATRWSARGRCRWPTSRSR